MYTIIALGGSLIIQDKIQTEFLAKFRKFILRFTKKGLTFVIVAGGGRICRVYQDAARHIVRIPDEDMDWLGIHATRLNGHLLRTIFWKEAHPTVIDDLSKPIDEECKHCRVWMQSEARMRSEERRTEGYAVEHRNSATKECAKHGSSGHKIVIAAGTRPGWSTDYVAIMLAKRFGAKRVIVAGTYDSVYDKDFEKYPDAKKLPKLTWKHYRKLIAKKWSPGYRAPIDPVAARTAKRYGIRVDVVKAESLANFARCIDEKKFEGSVIE